MREIITNCFVGFVGYKSLACFGKKDYADVILFVMVLYVGISISCMVGGWYDSLMNSALVKLLGKVFG